MKAAIISLKGTSSTAITEACQSYFDQVDHLSLRDFEVHISNGGIDLSYLKQKLEDYDCVYIRGSYKYAMLQRAMTRALSGSSYLPIKSSAFTLGHDKFLTMLELRRQGIAIPKTYYAASLKTARKILEQVDYPVIIKLQQGTQGKGVMIADSLTSAKTILDMLEDFKKPFIIQEFVPTSGTSDIRVIVAGEKIIAAYKRVAAKGDIRSNTHAGGTREPYTLTEEQEKLAIESAKAIGADICGVDILNAKEPSIIEVNLSPSFTIPEEICDANIAQEIAAFLYTRTRKFKRQRKKKEREKRKKKERRTLKMLFG